MIIGDVQSIGASDASGGLVFVVCIDVVFVAGLIISQPTGSIGRDRATLISGHVRVVTQEVGTWTC